ncbi:MAG: hypothetical protein JRI49_07080 [Deltaproteobacteria bacterium]|nr:hypothetical protein [Deltaproteobacteria bacterium]
MTNIVHFSPIKLVRRPVCIGCDNRSVNEAVSREPGSSAVGYCEKPECKDKAKYYAEFARDICIFCLKKRGWFKWGLAHPFKCGIWHLRLTAPGTIAELLRALCRKLRMKKATEYFEYVRNDAENKFRKRGEKKRKERDKELLRNLNRD